MHGEDDATTAPSGPRAGEVVVRAAALLRRRGVPDARLDVDLLLARAMGTDRAGVIRRFDDPLRRGERRAFAALLRKRARRVPIAYLLGEREFHGVRLEVGPDVLVPRPESELLVDVALERLRDAAANGARTPRLLDAGTGSGALAIAAAVADSRCRAVAFDRSRAALVVARRNAARHGLLGGATDAPRLVIVRADLACAPFARGAFDVIVANPPYVTPVELLADDAAEVRHEPRIATVGENLGWPAVYDAVLRLAEESLAEGGTLAVEAGRGRAADVRAMFAARSFLEESETRLDLAGVERVVLARAALSRRGSR